MYYAQLNEDRICVGISELSSEIIDENMIQINEFDITLLNKRYMNGEWIKVEYTSELLSTPEPTQLDIIEEAVLKSNEELRQEGYDNCVMDMVKEGVI